MPIGIILKTHLGSPRVPYLGKSDANGDAADNADVLDEEALEGLETALLVDAGGGTPGAALGLLTLEYCTVFIRWVC